MYETKNSVYEITSHTLLYTAETNNQFLGQTMKLMLR